MNIGYFAFIISQFGYQCVKVAVHRMLLTAFPVKFCYITSVSMHLTEFLHHLCLWEVIRIKSSFCYCERIIPQPRPTLCDPHGLYNPWNSPCQNTGVDSISLLQGSSQTRDLIQVSHIEGGFFTSWAQGKPRKTGVGSLSLLQGIFPTEESNQGLLHCRQFLYWLNCS